MQSIQFAVLLLFRAVLICLSLLYLWQKIGDFGYSSWEMGLYTTAVFTPVILFEIAHFFAVRVIYGLLYLPVLAYVTSCTAQIFQNDICAHTARIDNEIIIFYLLISIAVIGGIRLISARNAQKRDRHRPV